MRVARVVRRAMRAGIADGSSRRHSDAELIHRSLEGDCLAARDLHREYAPIATAFLRKLGIRGESSESERRADDAERELMEWKKMKFMEGHIGEEFEGLIISVTKFGFFVELKDWFIEGLVPLASLMDDRYMFHENTKQIIGQRTRKTYSIGDTVHVIVDRIDPMLRKINFAVIQDEPVVVQKKRRKH